MRLYQIKQFSATCSSCSTQADPLLRCLIRHSQKFAHVPYREFLFGHLNNFSLCVNILLLGADVNFVPTFIIIGRIDSDWT